MCREGVGMGRGEGAHYDSDLHRAGASFATTACRCFPSIYGGTRKVDWRRVIVALQGAVPAGRPSVSDTRLFDRERAIAREARRLATVRPVAVERGAAVSGAA